MGFGEEAVEPPELDEVDEALEEFDTFESVVWPSLDAFDELGARSFEVCAVKARLAETLNRS